VAAGARAGEPHVICPLQSSRRWLVYREPSSE
jgi:hypothetical protein